MKPPPGRVGSPAGFVDWPTNVRIFKQDFRSVEGSLVRSRVDGSRQGFGPKVTDSLPPGGGAVEDDFARCVPFLLPG